MTFCTTRHVKAPAIKFTVTPGCDDLAEVSGYKRNYYDAIGDYHLAKRCRDCAAHQRTNTGFNEILRLLYRQFSFESVLLYTRNPA